MKEKNIYLIFIIIIGVFLAMNITKFKVIESVDYSTHSKQETYEITGEITKDLNVREEIINYIPNVNSIEVQFANFNNRINQGTLNIKVTVNDEVLASNNYDVSEIKDGEFIKIGLNKNLSGKNDKLIIDISSKDSIQGSAVTLWMSEKEGIYNNTKLMINGIEVGKSLNIKLNYESPKIGYHIFVIFILIVWIMYILKIYYQLYVKLIINLGIEIKKYRKYLSLIIFAFVIICLRDLSFLSEPTIYAEDGIYISNIFNHGLLNSIFTTRGGGHADFQNSGSYILLYLALILNKLFNGYNLSYLPTYIGIISNLFFALVALVTYVAFEKVEKKFALISYLCIILIPTGRFGSEIFGRTLNTVFIWPVFTAMLLIILNRSTHKSYFKNTVIGFTCLIAGLSFPISYGIVGIYLLHEFILLIVGRLNKIEWLKKNFILLINIAIGIYLLPTMIESKGITETMQMKKDSIIEFVIARHILYPFIYPVYKFLNDSLTIIIFSVLLIVIFYAMYLKIKKYDFNNSYIFMLLFSGVYWISSAGMRIKMTSIFDKYKSSFPDRYFYGCNILAIITFIYAVIIILEYYKINQHLIYSVQKLIIIILLINPNLFQLMESDIKFIGGYNIGTFKESINNSIKLENINYETGMVNINIYPKDWVMEIPYIYAVTTGKE